MGSPARNQKAHTFIWSNAAEQAVLGPFFAGGEELRSVAILLEARVDDGSGAAFEYQPELVLAQKIVALFSGGVIGVYYKRKVAIELDVLHADWELPSVIVIHVLSNHFVDIRIHKL